MIMRPAFFVILLLTASIWGCQQNRNTEKKPEENSKEKEIRKKIRSFAEFSLTTDVSKLSDNEKSVIPYLIKASQLMDIIFWMESYGDRQELMARIASPVIREYADMNYGPWDRMDGDKPFVEGVGPKPKGANFYPHDMTKEEFEKAELPGKDGLYTLVRRDDNGKLITVPYHVAFKKYVEKAADYLRKAAEITGDTVFAGYLRARADALLTDNYRPSDMLWMDMKNNHLDIVIGPVETYEDQLFGYKAAHEAYVLVKDMDWSERLKKYIAYLPELQRSLPVDEAYKREKPGMRSDLNAYDAVYYAGEANTGGKTIAINLPNDETVQLKKGSRRLQLKNVMKAKFDKILVPIAGLIIDPSQRKHVKFDAFFANTMFHEVAHGLGIKNTINGKGPVRTALKEHYSAIEEGKADILGLYMVSELLKKGVLKGDMKDYMTTFMASIFRSIRFGAHEAHGMANLIRFNYFKEQHAFERNPDGTYRVNYENFDKAMRNLSGLILKLQGDGDYAGVQKLVDRYGHIGKDLQDALNRIQAAGIPVDIRFKQGEAVLFPDAKSK